MLHRIGWAFLSFAIAACDGAGMGDEDGGGDPEMDAGMRRDGGSDPERDAGEQVDPDAGPVDPSFAERIDPSRWEEYTNADYVNMGRARSGHHGAGTAQTNDVVRYVSAAEGNDENDGSEASPWQTLQHAADTVAPGTTVLVDDSAPYEGGLEITRGGSFDNYIVFANEVDGAYPEIVGGPTGGDAIRIAASNIVVQGFEIRNYGSAENTDVVGIRVEPDGDPISNIEIRNNVLHHIGPGHIEEDACSYNAHAIIVTSENDTVRNVVIDANEIYETYVGNSECLVLNGDIDGFTVSNNYVHDVNNIAIDAIGYEISFDTARNGTISDNIILDASNGYPYCTRGNCTYEPGANSSNGIYIDGGADIVIEYNVVGRTDLGIELQSENKRLVRDVEVRFNIVFNSNYENYVLGPNENVTEHDNQFFDDDALARPDMFCD
jgi:hypothetical protein